MKRQPGARITDPSFTRAVETAESQETFDFAGSRTLPFFSRCINVRSVTTVMATTIRSGCYAYQFQF
jgi:hypothetical protein